VPRVIETHSRSPRQTRELGRALGELLSGGEVIELCGPLGSGKTELTKGLAVGLGIPEDEPVVSPTFVLVREYVGRLRLYHCDAYRLRTVDELLALGLEEMLEPGDSVIAIEWADRFPGVLPAEVFRVDLAHENQLSRRIHIAAPSRARATQLRRRLAKTDCDARPAP